MCAGEGAAAPRTLRCAFPKVPARSPTTAFCTVRANVDTVKRAENMLVLTWKWFGLGDLLRGCQDSRRPWPHRTTVLLVICLVLLTSGALDAAQRRTIRCVHCRYHRLSFASLFTMFVVSFDERKFSFNLARLLSVFLCSYCCL